MTVHCPSASLALRLRLLCASAALDLQMDRADVRLQGAGRPERHAFAVGARVVPALLVHRLDVRLQGALRPEGDTRAVGALVLALLQVHQVDVRRQAALGPKATPGQ